LQYSCQKIKQQHSCKYRKIPIINPGLIFVKKSSFGGLIFGEGEGEGGGREGLIIGGSFAGASEYGSVYIILGRDLRPKLRDFEFENAGPEGMWVHDEGNEPFFICISSREIQAKYKECNTTKTEIVRSNFKLISIHTM